MSVFHVKHKIGLLLYSKTILSYVCLLTKFLCVKVRLSIYEKMFHVFQMGMTLMPESKKAWVEVSKFLEQLMINKYDCVSRETYNNKKYVCVSRET